MAPTGGLISRGGRAFARALLLLLVAGLASGCVRRMVTAAPGAEGLPLEDPPEGMVHVNVVSDEPGQTWDVFSGNTVVCTTPCRTQASQWETLLLKSRDGDRAWAPTFGLELPGQKRVLLIAEGTRTGEQVNGIVFTTLGGMGVITGVVLTAVGCSDVERRPGTCTAGLITGGVTLAVTAAAIWMLVDSLPRAHVLPVVTMQPVPGQPKVTLRLTPAGVAGTF